VSEVRLCKCGCLTPLVKRANEKTAKFNLRQYVHPSHYYGGLKKHKTKTCPVCRKRFTRKRKTDGRLESTYSFDKRIMCSRECYAEVRKGKKQHAKVSAKPPIASPSRPRVAARPKAAPKPKPTPVKPQTASQRVLTGLPDPTRGKWETIAPATIQDNPCPLHPSERAGKCTSCLIASKPHRTVARVGDSTPAWRRN